MWTRREAEAAQKLIDLAIAEDLAGRGDVTSELLIPEDLEGSAAVVVRCPGVVVGGPLLALVFGRFSPAVEVHLQVRDGLQVDAGAEIARIHGPMRPILSGERTALNFLQRLSGIGSLTAQYVAAVAGTKARIYDTRKTTPGWRILEKYAVRCGGGHNHRMGLFDAILIKDNHLAALGSCGGELRRAIAICRKSAPQLPIEIEVDTLDQLTKALEAEPDIVLLDNMPPALLRQAVALRDQIAPHVALEASGGITLATVRSIAKTGVDRISVGALTHSAPAIDIALDYGAQPGHSAKGSCGSERDR